MNLRIPEETREAVIVRSRMCCEDCKVNKANHMHHLTYERKGHELPEDLLFLCVYCHGKRHPKHKFRTMPDQHRIHDWKLRRNHSRIIASIFDRLEKLEHELQILKSSQK